MVVSSRAVAVENAPRDVADSVRGENAARCVSAAAGITTSREDIVATRESRGTRRCAEHASGDKSFPVDFDEIQVSDEIRGRTYSVERILALPRGCTGEREYSPPCAGRQGIQLVSSQE